MREEIIGNARLILGDCREVLPTLTGVDAVVTDPPYGMNKDISNDSPEVADELVKEIISALKAACKGNILAFWSAQRMGRIDYVFQPKRIMIWNKTFALYAPHNVGYRYEPLIWVSGKTAENKRGDIFEAFPIAFKVQEENAAHPTQKPLELMNEIVRDFTTPGSTVLDPFMGSGSTGCAATSQGRNFIGIETDERYFSIACRRIEAAQRQTDLFVTPATPAPKTPDMFAEHGA